MKRKRALAVAVASLSIVAMLALASCGGSSGTATTDFPLPTEAPSDAQKGGTIEVLSGSDIDYMDPGASYYQFTFMIHYAMFRPLLSWPPGETKTPQPDLAAEQPTISDDGKTVTFKIREGVKFAPPVDREVTSADVKYAIERGLMPGVANGYIGAYMDGLDGFDAAIEAVEKAPTVAPDISGIKTPDDQTIVFELTDTSSATLIQALSLPVSAPVPEEYAKQYDSESPSTYGDHVAATGPYMVENDAKGALTGYEPGKEIRLVRNPNWDSSSDARPAYADRITVKEGYADSASASRQILTGEGQLNGDFGPPPSVLREAATRYKEQLSLPTSGGSRYVSLNTQLAPLDDLNVRKAVLAATNREALRLTAGGEAAGAIANHFIPPDIPGFEEAGGFDGTGADFLEKPAGDLALASEYMKKAGYKSGKYDGNDELLMVGDDSASSRQIGEIMLDTFQKLGFKVNYRPVSQEIMYTKFCGTPAAKVAICATTGWLKDFNDAESLLDPTFNGNNILPSNNVNWPQLDVESINDAMAKAALLTDQDERIKAWADIDRQITAQAPALPWIWDNSPVIWSENVAPVINLFNATADLSYTSLKK